MGRSRVRQRRPQRIAALGMTAIIALAACSAAMDGAPHSDTAAVIPTTSTSARLTVHPPPTPTPTGEPTGTTTTQVPPEEPGPVAVTVRQLQPAAVVADGSPTMLSVGLSAALFGSTPVVVLTSTDAQALTIADERAQELMAPVVVVPADDIGYDDGPDDTAPTPEDGTDTAAGDAADLAAIAEEVDRLGARWLLVGEADVPARDAADRVVAALAGMHGPDDPEPPTVVADSAAIEVPARPDPLAGTTVLLPADATAVPDGLATALRATAAAVGADVVEVHGPDPRADEAAIEALAAQPPDHVIAVGSSFGPPARLAERVATAATGVELPGGGQVMFPGRTLVALYGNPRTGALGALGQQGLDAAIDRAAGVAADYDDLVDEPVVPTFEIIATIAASGAGPDGMYSTRMRVASLRPWVERAGEAGMYVILDLQPGRAHLLDQAKAYRELLELPYVGLALDPEWKLDPGQKPLQQIGGVDAAEVNQVIDWLAELVAQRSLPQKTLVLHQFRLSMLRDAHDIDTGRDEVAVVIHMDGQGSAASKENTWRAVVAAAPDGVTFGWKNFYAKDHPVLTPAQTMDRDPVPVMISYQ